MASHLGVITFVSLIGIGLAQSTCVSLLSKANSYVVETEEACKAIGEYEQCISGLSDGADKSQHEIELQKLQSKFQNCVNVLKYSPKITARDETLHMEGANFIFARTKRDTVNLYDLRDKVDGYEQTLTDSIEDTNRRVDSMKTNLTTQINTLLTTIEIMQQEDSPCIPYTEWEAPSGECILLTKCHSVYQYTSVQPTRTSDRQCADKKECASDEFISKAGDENFDNVCTKLSTCGPNQYAIPQKDKFTDVSCRDISTCRPSEYESKAPTSSSDRECDTPPESCPPNVVGTYPILVNGFAVQRFCVNSFTLLTDPGGDGSSKNKAGKSCYTIRQFYNKRSDGTYWIFTDDVKTPFQAFCDMTSCGGDYQNSWVDKSLCGGWTMIMQVGSGSNCLNRQQNTNWKTNNTFGTTLQRKNTCGKSVAYHRSSFTDVMIQSHRSGKTSRNVAWRHPTSLLSVANIVQSCTWKSDGELIVPGYGNPTSDQRRYAIRNMDWVSGKGSTEAGYNFHDTCYKDSTVYKWGFLNRDSDSGGGQNSIVQCRSPWGHSGNVLGFGSGCGNNQLQCSRNYGSDDGRYTRCVSAWGFGSGYGSTGTSGQDSHSVMGHWWGHGSSYMAQYETGLYVRDVEDI